MTTRATCANRMPEILMTARGGMECLCSSWQIGGPFVLRTEPAACCTDVVHHVLRRRRRDGRQHAS